MITPNEFVSWWGEEDLFRFPPMLLADLTIPEEQKRFLREAGLPRQTFKVPGHIDFQLLHPVWSLELLPQPQPLNEVDLSELLEDSLDSLEPTEENEFDAAQPSQVENDSPPNLLGDEATGLLKFLESDEINQSNLLGQDASGLIDTVIDLPGRSEFHLLERVGTLRVLGVSWFMKYISLDESASGSVIHYNGDDLRQTQHARYFSIVNTSISQFAESLLTRRTWWQALYEEPLSRLRSIPNTVSDAEYRAYTGRRRQLAVWLEKELRRIDPEALALRRGFWRVVLKDLREDL